MLHNTLKEIEAAQFKEQYGADLPEPLREMAREYQELKQGEADRVKNEKDETARTEQRNLISSEYDQIEEMAKEYGVSVDWESFNQFALDQNVPANMLSTAFSKFIMPEILRTTKERTQDTVLANKATVKKQTVPASGAPKQKAPDKGAPKTLDQFSDRLSNILS